MKNKIKLIDYKWFHDITSYNAFIYAVDHVEKINKKLKEEYLVRLKYEGLLEGKFIINIDAEKSYVAFESFNCKYTIAGDEYINDKIYVRKKSVIECLNDYLFIPKNNCLNYKRVLRR